MNQVSVGLGRTPALYGDVAVVIPTFGRQEDVNRAARSALAQTLAPRDVIIVDDGTPTPIELDPDLRGRARIVRLSENHGPSSARNIGIEATVADWIAFLDSDDEWHPAKLETQFRFLMATDSSPLAAVTSGWWWREEGHDRPLGLPKFPQACLDPKSFAKGCRTSPGSTLVIRRSAFIIAGPFDQRLRRLEDFEWSLRFGQAGGRVHVCPERLAVITPGRRASLSDIEAAAEMITASVAGPIPLTRTLKATLHLERAAAHLHARDWPGGLGHLVRSLAQNPWIGLPWASAFVKRATIGTVRSLFEPVRSERARMGAPLTTVMNTPAKDLPIAPRGEHYPGQSAAANFRPSRR